MRIRINLESICKYYTMLCHIAQARHNCQDEWKQIFHPTMLAEASRECDE